MEDAPLIVSCGLDDASFRFFDDLRRAHFPPALNHLSAHLTLFHHLPGDREDDVRVTLAACAERAPPPALSITGLRKLGRGVAYTIDAPGLQAVRRRIADAFADALSPQDRQGFRPHVTVQNKVDPPVAAALHDRLAADFSPWSATGVALQLWRYRGGPWEPAGAFPFKG